MVFKRNHTIKDFEQKIKTREYALIGEKHPSVHRALISERADLFKALTDFTWKKTKELAEFQEKHGRNCRGRRESLPHNWWNEDEEDQTPATKSLRSPPDDKDEFRRRLLTPFNDRWDENL